MRGLGPDCSRIDLDELVHHSDIASLLNCVGAETANIHVGTPKARKIIRASWRGLPKEWLETAAHRLRKSCVEDWHDFKKSPER